MYITAVCGAINLISSLLRALPVQGPNAG